MEIGDGVGLIAGVAVGDAVGEAVGDAVGLAVGSSVGDAVEKCVGSGVGIQVGNCVGLATGDCVEHLGRWLASETSEHIVLEGIICDAPPRKKFLPATMLPTMANSAFHEDTFLYLKDTTLSAAAALKGPVAFGLSRASPSFQDSKTLGSLWHTPSPPFTAEKPGLVIF